jgi:hypothetical protein
MTLYFCSPPNVVRGVHDDDKVWLDPVKAYGINTYVICDYGGSAAKTKAPPDNFEFEFPTITAQMQADSCKLECRRRINVNVSDQAQRNMSAHLNNITTARMTTAPARPTTPEEQADIDTINAIFAWINRPAPGMLATSDALVAANDLEWYSDVKWPPWDTAWDAFVKRF